MLTSGRMSNKNRDIITKAYSSSSDSIRVAEQLFISAPEFHSTGLVRSNGINRQIEPVTGTCKSYKAVVHIMLKGGCDSYNMLVPHSQCQAAGKGVFQQSTASHKNLIRSCLTHYYLRFLRFICRLPQHTWDRRSP